MKLPKLYVITKYIYATSISDALKQDKSAKPDSVFLDLNEYLRTKDQVITPPVGFGIKNV